MTLLALYKVSLKKRPFTKDRISIIKSTSMYSYQFLYNLLYEFQDQKRVLQINLNCLKSFEYLRAAHIKGSWPG